MSFIHTTSLDSPTVAPCVPPQGCSATPPATGHMRRTQHPDGRPWVSLAVRSDQRDGNLIPDRVRMSRSVPCSTAELAAKTSRSLSSLRRRDRRGSIAMTTTTRLQIAYEDESLCLRSSENAFRLFAAATSSPAANDAASSSNSRLLTRKALRYRNLLGRVQQADLSDPTFDVADFCGITWSKRAMSGALSL